MTKVLFHRHTPWRSDIRCSTNIFADLFGRDGYETAYMQGIVHAGNIAFRRGQWESWQKRGRWDHGAFVFTPFGAIPYSRFWPFNTAMAAAATYSSCMPSIARILSAGGFGEPDVIWTTNPGSGVLKKLFPNSKLVFQVVDYYPAFSGDTVKKIERRDYGFADHIFVIGESLKDYIVREHEIATDKITVLGQGVSSENYIDDLPIPADLSRIQGPIGIWVGVIAKADPELMAAVADALEQKGGSLVMIGPPAPWANELSRIKDNVHVLGPRSPDDVPAYLMHADFGVMLYDRRRMDIYRGQNPLKLYEYAAAGLPALSTAHDEFATLNPPVLQISEAAEVVNAVHAALSDPGLSEKMREFVRHRSWHSVFLNAREKIEQLLNA